MASAGRSLRSMVEQWLNSNPENVYRISQFRRSSSECYVCVEATSAVGPVSMFFFRHPDGTWCVFPPSPKRPAMRITEMLPSAKGNGRIEVKRWKLY